MVNEIFSIDTLQRVLVVAFDVPHGKQPGALLGIF
jgi:hypothetical protein